MAIDFIKMVFQDNYTKDALVWKDKIYTYQWLLDQMDYCEQFLNSNNIKSGQVVALEADFSPRSIALFISLIEQGCILVPLTRSVADKKEEFINIAQVEILFRIDDQDEINVEVISNKATHPFYKQLKNLNHPGLVLFSSGSTGKNKAVVHDFLCILEKFKTRRQALRTITFLLYDHIGGINTLLYTLSNGGCIITVQDRSPESVLSTIEKFKAELLPTSPTFINLILISEAYNKYDLSSLKILTYGTEPMLESTLKKFNKLFPNIQLLQTYGLSELGILHSKSKDSSSLWVKVGGEGFKTKVEDGILYIKARSSMLGYLNAPSPFTDDGWFNTQDRVLVDGDYIKILGRSSEIINVGGEKVYPAEVESVIQEMNNVLDASVYKEKNFITGNIVCVKVNIKEPENHNDFVVRLKNFCLKRMAGYKVPVKVLIVDDYLHSQRFKKKRLTHEVS